MSSNSMVHTLKFTFFDNFGLPDKEVEVVLRESVSVTGFIGVLRDADWSVAPNRSILPTYSPWRPFKVLLECDMGSVVVWVSPPLGFCSDVIRPSGYWVHVNGRILHLVESLVPDCYPEFVRSTSLKRPRATNDECFVSGSVS